MELSRKIMPHRPNMMEVLTLQFSTTQKHGLLLWQGDFSSNHFLAVAVVGGRVQFRFNLGAEAAVINTLETVNDGGIRTIVVTRSGRMGTLKLDSHKTVEGKAKGGGDQLQVKRRPVYLGKSVNLPKDQFSHL